MIMGNKKKQTNEFDNYFDDDFEVVYEDPEDLGSYLSEDSSDNSDDYDDYDGYDGDTDYYDDYDDDDDDDGNRNDHRGVGQRADDLGLGLGGLVVILVQALEAFLQRAGLLARAHGLDKGLRETGHVVFKALRHRIARTDILGHLFEHPTRVLAAALRGDHLHTAHHGKACGQDAGSNAPCVP